MTCPECGGAMEIDRCCVIEEQTYRYLVRGRDTGQLQKRLAAAALCTQCECCIELGKDERQ